MIFDSDILIWRLRNHAAAVAQVERVPLAERNLSVVSYLELLHGCRDLGELKRVQTSVIEHFAQVIPLTEVITQSAMRLMERHALARRPEPGDVLIAATALHRGETLITCNRKHFDFVPGLELKIFRP